MSKPQIIFFDAAGTLLAVRGGVGEIYRRTARAYGVEIEAAALQQGFARSFAQQPPMAFAPELSEAERLVQEREWWRVLVREVFAEAGAFARFDEFFAEVFEYFRRREAWQVYDDVEPTLAALRARGLRLAVISNFDARLEDLLRAFDLDHYFEALHLSTRAGAAKPDAAIFRSALASHRVAPAQAWHVGDSLREDAMGAAAVGINAILLDRDDTHENIGDFTRLTRLDQLLDLLQQTKAPPFAVNGEATRISQ